MVVNPAGINDGGGVPRDVAKIRAGGNPDYETDLGAVGENRCAVDPDGDRVWHLVHGLDQAAIDELHEAADYRGDPA